MRNEDFHTTMEQWASEEVELAPPLQPTDEMRQKVADRRKRRSLPARWWLAAGISTAAVVLVLALAPTLWHWLRSSRGTDAPAALVAMRPGVGAQESAVGPKVHRGGGGPKGGPAFLRQLAFQYQRAGDETIQVVDLLRSTPELPSLSGDDNYRLLITPLKSCQVQIYQSSDDGRLIRLFPAAAFSSATNPLEQQAPNHIPSAPNWFHLTDLVGTQKLHIIVSAAELTTLGELHSQYTQESDQSVRQRLFTQLMAQIQVFRDKPGHQGSYREFAFQHD